MLQIEKYAKIIELLYKSKVVGEECELFEIFWMAGLELKRNEQQKRRGL